jgi:hypothetical protein
MKTDRLSGANPFFHKIFIIPLLLFLLILIPDSVCYGLDIFYTATISNPSSSEVNLRMEVSNITVSDFWIIEYRANQGFFLNVIKIEAKDSAGKQLVINSFPGIPGSENDKWELKTNGSSEAVIDYTIKASKIDSYDNSPTDPYYYSYLTNDFGVFMPETLFIFPGDTSNLDSIKVRFVVPEIWEIICPWQMNDGIYDMSLPKDPMGKFYFPTIIGFGEFEKTSRFIGDAHVSVANYKYLANEKKHDLSDKVFKIYRYLTSVWGSSLKQPFIVIFGDRAADGTDILGGFCEGGIFYDETDPPDYNGLIAEIVEYRYSGWKWGIARSGDTSWYFSGCASYYSMKTLLKILYDTSYIYDLFIIYQEYLDNYVKTGKDVPLKIVVPDYNDGWLPRNKGILFMYLIAEQLYLDTNGKKNIDDFSKYLFQKYWGTTGGLQSLEDFKNDLEAFSSINFSQIFNDHAFGTKPISIVWGYEDDDGDGLLNAVEIIWDTNPNKVDTDNDGYSDSLEVEGHTDPTNRRSCPGECPPIAAMPWMPVLLLD